MKHTCFACDASNPERIVVGGENGWRCEFVDRFVGPVGRVHGGIAVGMLTCPAMQIAERNGVQQPLATYVSGRILNPIPLMTSLQINVQASGSRYQVDLHDGNAPCLTGNVEVRDQAAGLEDVLQPVPDRMSDSLEKMVSLADANLTGPTVHSRQKHEFAQAGYGQPEIICFGCSEKPGALKLFNRLSDSGQLWTRWETEPGFVDEEGKLATCMIAAALDCSNLWVIDAIEPDLNLGQRLEQQKMWITGTFNVHFLRVPPIDKPGGYRVVTRFLNQEGRKAFTMSAMLDRNGTVYAVSDSIAILINMPPEVRLTKLT
jgi:hypothetical protein